MPSHVGQRCGHHREIAAADQDRALLEVDVERRFGLLVHQAEVEQQVGDRPIPMTGAAFRVVDRAIDRELASRDDAEPIEEYSNVRFP